MEKFKNFTGIVAPLDRANVDTDQIIPKQFLKSIVRSGLGAGLFYDWRHQPDSQFVLQEPRFKQANILVARANFGCGSSREHAVWTLHDYGIRAVLAPSFGDIFLNNCFQNGLLPVVLSAERAAAYRMMLMQSPGSHVAIDLEGQTVAAPDGTLDRFKIDPFRKQCLLAGMDDISFTLSHREQIAAFENAYESTVRWL
jgi:3-isopropylmalate/(R)-2-methylmalate dehydratase small subunit